MGEDARALLQAPALREEAERALAGEGKGGTAVSVKVSGCHRLALGHGQLLLSPFAHAIGRAIVDSGVEVGPDAVVAHTQNQVVEAVVVEVGDGAGPCAFGRQFGAVGGAEGVIVDVGRRAFLVVLAVAEYQVQVAVSVEVVLVDALQHAGAGNVEVLACVAELALSKVFEAAGGPGIGHGLRL